MPMFARGLIAAFCLSLPQVAPAQEVIGEIVATLDGVERTWQTLHSSAVGESYNTYLRDYGGSLDVDLHGYGGSGGRRREALMIHLSFPQGSDVPTDITVLYFGDGIGRSWGSIDGEEILSVARFDPEDGIEGELSGRLCFKRTMLAEPDPRNCITIHGRFASAVPVEGE